MLEMQSFFWSSHNLRHGSVKQDFKKTFEVPLEVHCYCSIVGYRLSPNTNANSAECKRFTLSWSEQ